MSETKDNLEEEIDSLFKLPLADFIGARNELAARLKKDKRADDANLVKALAKPTVTAWAVNQLYWNHREEFDALLTASESFRLAQSTRTSNQSAEMREALDARRDALSDLSKSATSVLNEAGHGPAPDTINRITTTLEAISAYASLPLPDSPRPGRLTRDVDPPGFESLVALMGGGIANTHERPASVSPAKGPSPVSTPAKTANIEDAKSRRSGGAHARTHVNVSEEEETQQARQREAMRQSKIAAAKASLLQAEETLAETQARAQQLEAAHKEARAEEGRAEQEIRDAEEALREVEARLKNAKTLSREAAQHSKTIAAEAKEAARAVEDARREVEKTSKELKSIVGE
ncbi:MAG TPA: hypothetical protein VLZ81_05520 [Blastocatellia bacterium]|nr:hypothetical protein [Blastocatellia bacterium]